MENIQIIEKILSDEKIKYDEEMLKKVINFCEVEYKDKKKAGKPMLEHVIGVAKIVATLRIDDVSIYASLLHGILKCENVDIKKLKEMFGDEVVDIVITVNKLSCLNIKNKDKVDSEMLRNMFLAIAKDIRTVIIKLADRLYNMQNISYVDNEEVKLNMAKECLQIYAPIAHRLGMSKVKSELEDISFRVLMPVEYGVIKAQIDEKKKERELYIDNRINEVKKELEKQNIEASIYGRPKHFYSIYKKMKQKHCNADDLFDLLAIRVIVNSVKDCYSVLGIVHDMYKPMPGRFKDYIAVPKTNMYQSLHTTVFGEGGKPFEIQIRTWDMHNVAEKGIAAHFSYKEKTKKITQADQKIIWLRKTLEIQQDITDNTQNLDKIKGEIFGEEVFVFTPKGDIKALPKGATTVDFAYNIHQKVAEKMIGAKVNGKIVPLSTRLENTDIVEVITSSNSKGPTIDWLKFVKTTTAKNKITSFLKKQGKQQNIVKGKEFLEKELKKKRYLKDVLNDEKIVNEVLRKSNFNSLDEVYENIGFGSISVLKIVNRFNEEYEKNKELDIDKVAKHKVVNNNLKNKNNLIEVEGIKNCKVKFAMCCSPIPGDDIKGYITLGNGISIHRADCVNIKALENTPSRFINVKWKNELKGDFEAKIVVKANASSSVLTEVLKKISDLKVQVIQISSRVTHDRENIMDLKVSVANIEMLQSVIKNLKKVDSVFEVKRVH